MKKRRNIILKIFLLIVLFLFQGIKAHSNVDSQRYNIEIYYNIENIESKVTPDNDLSDEDQIDQFSISYLSEQSVCQNYGLSTLPILNILLFSVWQPPKVY